MTREEAIKTLKENYCTICAYGSQDMDSCDIRSCDNKDAIKAFEQEPCEDAISREDALMALTGEIKETDTIETIIARSGKRIKSLPSVNPQPKTGHWIYDRTRDWDGECKYECSECGMGSDVDYTYCMRCGAKMVEPQESEE